MHKLKNRDEKDLQTTSRYRRQNMMRAMGTKIERGLVELITNSNDSYDTLEESGPLPVGKIRIEIERKRRGNPSFVVVKDRSSGMSAEELNEKIGQVGARTSGYEKGKTRRGLFGRGAKDVAIFGNTHFESIKDEAYSHFVITPSWKTWFEAINEKPTKEIRERLGIPRGNGTAVTIEAQNSYTIPHHEKLVDLLSRYYSLRGIMSNSKREVILVDVNTGKSDHLLYNYPEGNIVVDQDIDIPGYQDARVHILIRQHNTRFEENTLPLREGILVKSGSAIHECTYFQLESEPYCWRFSGAVTCEFIDKLVREYDEIEEGSDSPQHPENNAQLLIDPDRKGLVDDHPFTQSLKKECRRVLRYLVEQIKSNEVEPKKKVTDEKLNRQLDALSKEISKLYEKKLKDLDEDIDTVTGDNGKIPKLSPGMHIIPPGDEIIYANSPKTFTVKIVGVDILDEALSVVISSSNEDVKVRNSPVYLRKFSEDKCTASTTFTLESEIVSAESLIEITYNGYQEVILVTVKEPEAPDSIPDGLSFDKPIYHLSVNKEKSLYLWLKLDHAGSAEYLTQIQSGRPDIIIKGGGKCVLRQTDVSNVYSGKCRVMGRRAKAKTDITAITEGSNSARTEVIIEDKEPSSQIHFDFQPDEEDFGSMRYKWDENHPHILKIAAKHSSIRYYLGTPIGDHYPGRNTSEYHCVIAEVIAEALAFDILERQFRSEGHQGTLNFTTAHTYFNMHFSDFLNMTHKYLNPDYKIPVVQEKML